MKLTRVSRLLGRRALGATGPRAVSASASIVFTPTASETHEAVKSASASIVFSVVAAAAREGVAQASARIVFTAAATTHFPFGRAVATIRFTPTAVQQRAQTPHALATIVFLATASQFQTRVGVGSAQIIFHAVAALHPPGTVFGNCRATILFRARCKGKRPGVVFGDGYLGRYQVGQDVPLEIQCVDSNGAPSIPDAAPLVRLYRDGAFLATRVLPIETDGDAVGRFRGNYTLGNADEAGRYAVVYLYSHLGLPRGSSDIFEVVAGGDPAGAVIAGYSLPRPDGDFFLAHLAAGRIASGQTPYLDEGI